MLLFFNKHYLAVMIYGSRLIAGNLLDIDGEKLISHEKTRGKNPRVPWEEKKTGGEEEFG